MELTGPVTLNRAVELAAEYLHCAIAIQVGSTQSWRQATERHRNELRLDVMAIIEGKTRRRVRG
jgi:hypothetical protein